MRSLSIVASMLLLVACHEEHSPRAATMNAREIREAFQREAAVQGLRVKRVLPDGRILLDRNGTELTVSLENLIRSVGRGDDRAAIGRFVATIKATGLDLPDWPNARGSLRVAAEPSDHDFGHTVRMPLTDEVVRVLVYVTPDESRVTWINESQLRDWHISQSEAWHAAQRNMADLLLETPIRVEDIDGMQLGMFESDSVFKAALILSPNLKRVLQPRIGWPLYAVIPCRDFVYFFHSKELIPRVGKTVVQQYKSSGYPISADVFLISDSGIEAIGTFPLE